MTKVLLLLAIFVSITVVSGLDLRSFFKRSACINRKGDGACKGMESYCKLSWYAKWMKKYCAKTCNPTCRPASVKIKVRVNIQECLDAHDSKRALHGAAPLTWDSQLARKAQTWAIKLAQTVSFQRTEKLFLERGGGNLAVGWSNSKHSYTCKDAVQRWYDEEDKYPFSNPPDFTQYNTREFTQVVWKSTKHLGVAIARNGNKVYVVALYSPVGNYPLGFAKNVGALINST